MKSDNLFIEVKICPITYENISTYHFNIIIFKLFFFKKRSNQLKGQEKICLKMGLGHSLVLLTVKIITIQMKFWKIQVMQKTANYLRKLFVKFVNGIKKNPFIQGFSFKNSFKVIKEKKQKLKVK